VGLVERVGRQALKARRRGRPLVSRLTPHQAVTTVRYIVGRCPDQLSLPFALWTREAVQALLSRKFDLEVSVWTVGRYLRAWGLTPQKPVRGAYEQNPAAVRQWLKEECPAIRESARNYNRRPKNTQDDRELARYCCRWKIGVSRQGHINQSVKVRPRPKDSRLVAGEASRSESETMKPSDNILGKEYAQRARLQRAVNADVASLHGKSGG